MLTNFFFYSESKEKLKKFFILSKKLAIICDPPFGVFVSTLMKSLIKLREMFLNVLSKYYNIKLFQPNFLFNFF